MGEQLHKKKDIHRKNPLFNHHPGIKVIKKEHQNHFIFSLEFVSIKNVLNIINKIDCTKDSRLEIPTKVLKLLRKEILIPVMNCMNKCISKNLSMTNLNCRVYPIFKKNDPSGKPYFSKMLVKALYV